MSSNDDMKMRFGKYSGYTFQWICQNDIQYALKMKHAAMTGSLVTNENMRKFLSYVDYYISHANTSTRLRDRQYQEEDVIYCGKNSTDVQQPIFSQVPPCSQIPCDIETYIDISECSQPLEPSLSGLIAPPPSPTLVPPTYSQRMQQPIFYNTTSSTSLFSTEPTPPSSNIFNIRTYGHCYLLQVLAESKTQTPIFKIGRSDDILSRLQSEHYRNARIICVREVNNAAACEREIIETFKRRFRQVINGKTTSVGTEYFEGNEADIIQMFNFICSHYTL